MRNSFAFAGKKRKNFTFSQSGPSPWHTNTRDFATSVTQQRRRSEYPDYEYPFGLKKQKNGNQDIGHRARSTRIIIRAIIHSISAKYISGISSPKGALIYCVILIHGYLIYLIGSRYFQDEDFHDLPLKLCSEQ